MLSYDCHADMLKDGKLCNTKLIDIVICVILVLYHLFHPNFYDPYDRCSRAICLTP